MTIQLTNADLRKIFPKAPEAVIANVAEWQRLFDAAGITHTRTRLSDCLANVKHECEGFALPGLTESILYTPERACEVWPGRFSSADDCLRKVGSWRGDPDFHVKLIDHVYGGRMNNKPPPSHDGSMYIGRGGPQITGHDEYALTEKNVGIPALADPKQVAALDKQAAIIAAFWTWNGMNAVADTGDFTKVVKKWNGGTIGMADRQAQLRGIDPVVARLANREDVMPVAKQMQGAPPTPAPSPEVVAAATEDARKTRASLTKTGGAAMGASGGNEGMKASVSQPDKVPFMPSPVAWAVAGVGAVLIVVGVALVIKRVRAVHANWF